MSGNDDKNAELKELENFALKIFTKYLQIPTAHPRINYEPCLRFLTEYCDDLGLKSDILTFGTSMKPSLIATWQGANPTLPSILLNSHMDVVPVEFEKWTYPPFSAHDQGGKIFARGSQDMKSVGVQYLEAIRRLKLEGIVPACNVHVSFVPDEEIGGADGMAELVKSEEFKELHVGFALDEGMANAQENFLVYNGERTMWHMKFTCKGQQGHGSLLHEITAADKVRFLLDRILDFRKSQADLLKTNPSLTVGDVMTLNVTMMEGGVQTNVLPSELSFTVDCRLPVTTNLDDWRKQLETWCQEAGDGVFFTGVPFSNGPPTKLDDSNKYWVAFRDTFQKLGLSMETRIFPGGTDSRFLRAVGIPALGFSPIRNHEVLLHDNDEYLRKEDFLEGIEIYAEIIKSLASI